MLGAYHGEIGREATAKFPTTSEMRIAYHGEIGREATAKRSFQAPDGLGKSAALRAMAAKAILPLEPAQKP